MNDLHDDLIVFDGLIISTWSEDVLADMRRGSLSGANCTCCDWEGFAETTVTAHSRLIPHGNHMKGETP